MNRKQKARNVSKLVAGIEKEAKEEDKEVFRRIDNYWTDVSHIADETTSKPKYGKLSKLTFCILVLPHGNAEPERGFSINKLMLQIHGVAIHEETMVALRMVKEHILKCKGVMNVSISQDLIKSVYSAYQRYNIFMDAKKEEEKKAEEEKERKKLEAVEASKVSEVKERRQKEIKQHQKDKDTLKDGIAVADEILNEVTGELGKHCEGKTMDTKESKAMSS